ncbi:MAG: replication factor C large subunit [Candidatus Aenigmarchaeota archaeon]|nr:replication factor C large subunit [Candidatus Aenigmarchaeota archaeon]
MLWTDRHRPASLKEFAGNPKAVAEVLDFLNNFTPGKALLLSGPTGTGKTLLLELIAKERNYDLISLDASEKRGKEDIENFKQSALSAGLFQKGRIILVDEIEGISGQQDRGAAGAIAELIKASKWPVILISNDPYSPKLKTIRQHCRPVKMSKIPSPSIEKRLKEICRKEGIEFEGNAIQYLARWSSGDMRTAITDLQSCCSGKRVFSEKDLEILGYRERLSSIFETLSSIFKSKSIVVSKRAFDSSDKDPEEILLWIGNNIPLEFDKEDIERAYEILSRADVFRGRIIKQQNYRFRLYMLDMLSFIGLAKRHDKHGFVMYQPPQRLIMMARSKAAREEREAIAARIGGMCHCSRKIAKRDYLPYLKAIYGKDTEKMLGE